ncbi:MAG: O-antigen ligase family protein [Lentisphaeraceae bacterium]|nr:O-antigen ligase family protein [Lentisphaeraceae bacterium]
MTTEESVSERLCKYYIYVVIACLFLTYPLALFIPHGNGFNIFDLAVPTFMLASVLGFGLLKYKLLKSQSVISHLSIAGGTLILVFGLMSGSPIALVLKALGYVIIPLTLAFSLKKLEQTSLLQKLALALGLLWLVNIIHSYQALPSFNVYGTSGNKNWFSALVLATLPAAIYSLHLFLQKKMPSKRSLYTAIVICIGLSVLPIKAADSRASFVAIGLLLFYVPFLYVSLKKRLLVLAALAIGAVCLFFMFRQQLAWENTRNIRISVWESTLNLIKENPLTGVGPGSFEASFPAYESKAHKEMLVAGQTTQHPHNEVLYIASENGVLVAFIWCLLVGFTLCRRPKNSLDLCLSISFFILLVQGMMDKPLYQQPTMLLFYVLMGIIWQKSEFFKFGEFDQKFRKFTKVYAILILLAGGYLVAIETASSLYYREAIRAEAKQDFARSFEMAQESTKFTPWNLMAQYKAFVFSVKNLKQTELAKTHYEYLSKNAPNFRYFNLIEADYFLQLAKENPEKSQEYFDKAKLAFDNSCKLHSSDVLSHYDRMRFAVVYRDFAEVQKAQDETLGLYQRKYERYLNYFKVASFEKLIEAMLAKGTYGERAKALASIMGPLKYSRNISVVYPNIGGPLVQEFNKPFSVGDAVFASDQNLLAKAFDYSVAIPQLWQEIESKVKTTPGNSFAWPKTIYKAKQGSSFSKLCLFANLVRFKGLESAIFKDKGGYALIAFNQNELWLLKDGLVSSKTVDQIKALYGSINAEYFAYPQAYFLKNEFLSKVLSNSSQFPHYSTNPSYAFRLFQNLFKSSKFRISPMQAPFKSFMKRQK